MSSCQLTHGGSDFFYAVSPQAVQTNLGVPQNSPTALYSLEQASQYRNTF